jgi:hypothetical protein
MTSVLGPVPRFTEDPGNIARDLGSGRSSSRRMAKRKPGKLILRLREIDFTHDGVLAHR